ncbi:MAG: SpoVR family protein [Bdellovibrionota bacterium]|nr:MAG: SpoVR family protein [Pseudomonadota bacterium]
MNYNTQLTPELREIAISIGKKAREVGLDFFDTVFELIDYKQLNEIAAYGGFPTRYPHWRFGMDYERLSKSYTYGLSVIYEMVINNDPCYAYLLRANSLVSQKTVIAHVYGHCDFFKNNYWFQKTNRKMLDQMANHGSTIRRFIEEVGHDEVEDYLDACLSLENLIDIYAPHNTAAKKQISSAMDEEETYYRPDPVNKLQSKKYMDSYVNPKDFIDSQTQKQEEAQKKKKNFPEEPQRDVLKFLMENAPLNSWQRRVLGIIRDESYYFAPQGQTKILNEGWATYWHSQMMTELHPLNDSEIVDYCDQHSGVVASAPGQLNPYKLGLELLRHTKRRWDRGQFGLEYLNCDDPKKRAAWDTQAGLGNQKLFEIRRIHNDITFLDAYLDEDFCHEHKLFIYDYDRRNNRYVISDRDFGKVKSQLLNQLTNFGQPIILVKDGNFKNRNELLLEHKHEGNDLKHEFTVECLKNLFKIWRRPVHIETIIEEGRRRISFDGSAHSVEKL